MPNWCENTVTIIGSKEMLDDFEEHKLRFNHYVPRPAEEENNWYEWNCENWGTKWEVDSDDFNVINRDDEKIEIEFQTAWCPPIAFFKKLCLMYSKIYIECKYIEDGSLGRGIYIFTKNNEQLKETHYNWVQPCEYDDIPELEGEEVVGTIVKEKEEENKSTINIKL
jgi:hypothetical protein